MRLVGGEAGSAGERDSVRLPVIEHGFTGEHSESVLDSERLAYREVSLRAHSLWSVNRTLVGCSCRIWKYTIVAVG